MIKIPSKDEYYTSRHIDLAELKSISSMGIHEFAEYGDVVETRDGIYIFQNNNAPILAVAHLDTVIQEFGWEVINNGKTLKNPQLDDRLGAYIILCLLKKHGINYDILLTENEEIGRSTASHFRAPRKYNWMFEIDRFGDDVAMYKYYCQEYVKLLNENGWGRVSRGSNTDINHLGHLDITGFNFACAYSNNHSKQAKLDIVLLDSILDKLIPFLAKYQDIVLPRIVEKTTYQSTNWQRLPRNDDYWQSYADDTYDYCDTGSNTTYVSQHNQSHNDCDFCDSLLCMGTEECQVCGCNYHNSVFVYVYGSCSHCLQGILSDVPHIDDIIKSIKEVDADFEISLNYIMSLIGGSKW